MCEKNDRAVKGAGLLKTKDGSFWPILPPPSIDFSGHFTGGVSVNIAAAHRSQNPVVADFFGGNQRDRIKPTSYFAQSLSGEQAKTRKITKYSLMTYIFAPLTGISRRHRLPPIQVRWSLREVGSITLLAKQNRGRGRYRNRYRKDVGWDSDTRSWMCPARGDADETRAARLRGS